MKILEKKDFSAWQHVWTCKRCESKLEASHDDVHGTYHEGWSDPRDGSGGPAYWSWFVECPVCSEHHQIATTDIPKTMQVELEKRMQRRSSNYFDR